MERVDRTSEYPGDLGIFKPLDPGVAPGGQTFHTNSYQTGLGHSAQRPFNVGTL